MAGEFTISEELIRFINENTNDSYALQIILFFADHPYTHFNELAIIHALNQDGGRRYLRKALRALVDKGTIKTRPESNALVYSLPENIRSLASELEKLDTLQRQLLLRQTRPESVKKREHLFGDMAAEVLSQVSEAAVTSGQHSNIFQ